MAYKPIESYGVIGDLHSVALVGMDGSIDWCCLPRFDSPSIFAAILDEKKGGFFRVSARHETHRQMYLPDTNCLLTRFLSPDGVGEVVDFMPVGAVHGAGGHLHQIYRLARSVRGAVHFEVECRPAFDYARESHKCYPVDKGVVFETPRIKVGLFSDVELRIEENGAVAGFTLDAGQTATFALRHSEHGQSDWLKAPLSRRSALAQTMEFWRRWLAKSTYTGRWREMVDRSALVLKMLTYRPTGAIVAAPSCSLPEEIGGNRNWDYRYTWIRDAAFTIYAFLRLGFTEEADQFMRWLQGRVSEEEKVNGPLNVMYGIDGRHELPEEELSHLEGYRGAKPVRIGNAATKQLQLDIYGELIDSVYLYDKYGTPISYDQWNQLRRMMNWVAQNWEQPDEGIWEVRGGRHNFVFSKMQCWVALDRGLRMALKRGLPVDRERLRVERDRIYEAVMAKGFNAELGCFTQYFGSRAVDAGNLLMPLVRFISPKDPRMIGTLERTLDLLVSDSLVYRYRNDEGAADGLKGGEGTFSMCTFWLVEVLARAGRVEEARFIFEKMLTYANHLGLFAEEIGPSGEALGNFPQAFTHLSLISAAYYLSRTLDGSR